jgi:hypothetical protein
MKMLNLKNSLIKIGLFFIINNLFAIPIYSAVVFKNIDTLQSRPYNCKVVNSSILRAGTPIDVELVNSIFSNEIKNDQTINIRVKYNIVVDGKILIAAGAPGTVKVIRAVKGRTSGRPGFLEIKLESVQAVDGQRILIKGNSFTSKGKNKYFLTYGGAFLIGIISGQVLGILGLFLLGGVWSFLIKGKPAEIKSGTTLSGSTYSDTPIKINE